MKTVIVSLAGLYLLGFALFFVVEIASGPVTPALSFVRAVVWPVYWATGWPRGVHARMD
jgi:hypothetical protein